MGSHLFYIQGASFKFVSMDIIWSALSQNPPPFYDYTIWPREGHLADHN